MLVVGLTGGIGSGKSTVSAMLAGRGAAIVDADLLSRELQRPGEPVFVAMVERFGPGIVAEDGTLDRAAVAAIAFNDPPALADLNSITHPAIGAAIAARMAAYADTEDVVILDVPLLVESTALRTSMAVLIVVDAPTDVAIGRLVEQRGMEEGDARARIAAQSSREERLKLADFVIDNSGSVVDLESEVQRCWAWLQDRRRSSA